MNPKDTEVMARLATKGRLTIVETPEHVRVALQVGVHAITLENQDLHKLLVELEGITEGWSSLVKQENL